MHKDVYLADQSFQETNKNQVENIVLSTKVFIILHFVLAEGNHLKMKCF
jgi:hypothetical protein